MESVHNENHAMGESVGGRKEAGAAFTTGACTLCELKPHNQRRAGKSSHTFPLVDLRLPPLITNT